MNKWEMRSEDAGVEAAVVMEARSQTERRRSGSVCLNAAGAIADEFVMDALNDSQNLDSNTEILRLGRSTSSYSQASYRSPSATPNAALLAIRSPPSRLSRGSQMSTASSAIARHHLLRQKDPARGGSGRQNPVEINETMLKEVFAEDFHLVEHSLKSRTNNNLRATIETPGQSAEGVHTHNGFARGSRSAQHAHTSSSVPSVPRAKSTPNASKGKGVRVMFGAVNLSNDGDGAHGDGSNLSVFGKRRLLSTSRPRARAGAGSGTGTTLKSSRSKSETHSANDSHLFRARRSKLPTSSSMNRADPNAQEQENSSHSSAMNRHQAPQHPKVLASNGTAGGPHATSETATTFVSSAGSTSSSSNPASSSNNAPGGLLHWLFVASPIKDGGPGGHHHTGRTPLLPSKHHHEKDSPNTETEDQCNDAGVGGAAEVTAAQSPGQTPLRTARSGGTVVQENIIKAASPGSPLEASAGVKEFSSLGSLEDMKGKKGFPLSPKKTSQVAAVPTECKI